MELLRVCEKDGVDDGDTVDVEVGEIEGEIEFVGDDDGDLESVGDVVGEIEQDGEMVDVRRRLCDGWS